MIKKAPTTMASDRSSTNEPSPFDEASSSMHQQTQLHYSQQQKGSVEATTALSRRKQQHEYRLRSNEIGGPPQPQPPDPHLPRPASPSGRTDVSAHSNAVYSSNAMIPPQQQREHQQYRNNKPSHSNTAIGPSASNASSPAVVSSAGSYATANSSAMNQQIQQHLHSGHPAYYYNNQHLIFPQSASGQQTLISIESPLPAQLQRSLGDRSNEKRKNAALEIEQLIKQDANNFPMISAVITVLSKDFCTSMNSNYRKGGLVGLAATAIGLLGNTPAFLNVLLPPVLHCFDDPESRVRYYACESLYNIAKVSRYAILRYFNLIFDGLAKLFADVDVDVKNGANLLDRLMKDIVIEADADFSVEQFLPLLQNYIRRTNPYIRQLIVGWITLLDSIPDVSMLDYLPDFLDGLFNMLSDSNREIRQAADSALSDFLRELSVSTVLEFGPIISTLVLQCKSKERLNRLTAITWLAELTHHPKTVGGFDALLPFHANILGAIMCCISDNEKEIRLVAERTNDDLLQLVKDTVGSLDLRSLLQTLTSELLQKEDVPTKMASLRWINMLMEKFKNDMNLYTHDLLPVLLRTLSDPSDAVVLLDLQVLSRISLSKKRLNSKKVSEPFASENNEAEVLDNSNEQRGGSDNNHETEELQFQLVLNAILNLFAKDRKLLEFRGSLIIRKLCVLLNAKTVYMRMADTLSSYEIMDSTKVRADQYYSTLQFISTMVQTLNLILLTASELHDLRSSLASSFEQNEEQQDTTAFGLRGNQSSAIYRQIKTELEYNNNAEEYSTILDDERYSNGNVFATLFHCWCHNPVATFSLCLLAQAYDLSFALVRKFSDMDTEVEVGFLMQIDKLVHLLESPIFVHLRLQLLNVEAPYHASLLKSIYGVLMCLPQGDAYRLLNDRLATVCNLRDNLGISSSSSLIRGGGGGFGSHDSEDTVNSIVGRKGLDMQVLIERFDSVMEQHREAKLQAQRMKAEQNDPASHYHHTRQYSSQPDIMYSSSTSNNAQSNSSRGVSMQQQNQNPKVDYGNGYNLQGGGRVSLGGGTASESNTVTTTATTQTATSIEPLVTTHSGVPSNSSRSSVQPRGF